MNTSSSLARPTQDEIARRARQLWDERGRPSDADVEIWLEAEHQLVTEAAARSNHVVEKPTRVRRRRVAADNIQPEELAERLDDYGEPPRRSATSVDIT